MSCKTHLDLKAYWMCFNPYSKSHSMAPNMASRQWCNSTEHIHWTISQWLLNVIPTCSYIWLRPWGRDIYLLHQSPWAGQGRIVRGPALHQAHTSFTTLSLDSPTYKRDWEHFFNYWTYLFAIPAFYQITWGSVCTHIFKCSIFFGMISFMITFQLFMIMHRKHNCWIECNFTHMDAGLATWQCLIIFLHRKVFWASAQVG